MTEGIIQKWLGILEQELIGRGLNPSGNTTHRLVFDMITLTRQELIAEIEKIIEFPLTDKGDSLFWSDCHNDINKFKEALIGNGEKK